MRGERPEAVAILAKAPLPGAVKTRLCPPLSPAGAASLAAAMLRDTAREVAGAGVAARYLFFHPPDAAACFRGPDFAGYRLVPQRGADLGQRIENAFARMAAGGSRRAVVVGSDCPALSARRVREALRELREGARAVLGPAEDGGFYLVGVSGAVPALFRGVAWSGPSALRQVLDNLRAAALPFALLRRERDVDVPADLAALRRFLHSRAAPACPATRARLRLPPRKPQRRRPS